MPQLASAHVAASARDSSCSSSRPHVPLEPLARESRTGHERLGTLNLDSRRAGGGGTPAGSRGNVGHIGAARRARVRCATRGGSPPVAACGRCTVGDEWLRRASVFAYSGLAMAFFDWSSRITLVVTSIGLLACGSVKNGQGDDAGGGGGD